MPALTPFAEFATQGLRAAPPPGPVLHAAKRCLLDWVAATLPGSVIQPATGLREAFAGQIGQGPAFLLPDGARCDARTAALVHGAASHTVEFDDIFRDGIYHPGVPVISAALAASQQANGSGRDLLLAIIAGYEVSNRLARAVNPAHYEYWHTTGTIGTFGAAAAAAYALELDTEQALHALANAGTLAAGLQQAFRADSHAKPLHGAHAADAGLWLAMAAKAGVTGATDILEGPRGFGNAMCLNGRAEAQPDWQGAAAGLGTDWTITRTTVKNHAACGHMHAAVDGVLALTVAHGLSPEDIGEIQVASYAKALEITGGKEVTTAFEAKFSLAYGCAHAVVHGPVRMTAFDKDRIAAPTLQSLIKRVSITVDDEAEAAFPGRRSAKVTIVHADGRRLEHYAPTRKGDPDAPLTDEELEAKFRDLAEPVIGRAAAATLAKTIWDADTLPSLSPLFTARDKAAE